MFTNIPKVPIRYPRRNKKECRKLLIHYKKDILEEIFVGFMIKLNLPTPIIREVLSYFSARDILNWSANSDKIDEIIEVVKDLNYLTKHSFV
jgi:hypothetical protein